MGKGSGKGMGKGGKLDIRPRAAGERYMEESGKTVLVAETAASSKKVVPEITMDELAEHNSAADLWVAIEGKCYDLTKFKDNHPGGHLPLEGVAGRNATEPFENFHPAFVWKRLAAYHVADIKGATVSDYVAGHREIRQKLLERGMFETRMSYYYTKAACFVALAATFTACVTQSSSTGMHMLGACLIGLFWQQVAFVGHDIGHNSITHNRATDYMLGAVNVAVMGVSMGWWKRSHNTHHVVCNSVEKDPDIQHLPVMAVTPEILKGVFSTYHKFGFTPVLLDPIAHFVVCNQHNLYYVFMFFGRFNLYAQSFQLLLNFREKVEMRWTELAAMVAFWGWFGYLASHMSTTAELIGFVLLSHGVSGLLHIQITLSHFCMETYTKDKPVYTDDSNDWFRMQIATTMDVDCPEWLDWFHGGLQFQIEHHLFPRVPRHNLRAVRELVVEHCEKHGIHYHNVGFIQGNAEVIAAMRETAMAARALPRDKDVVETLKKSWIVEMMNAAG